jgi:hypothetical protein
VILPKFYIPLPVFLPPQGMFFLVEKSAASQKSQVWEKTRNFINRNFCFGGKK